MGSTTGADFNPSKQKNFRLGVVNLSVMTSNTPHSKMSTASSVRLPSSASKYSHLGFKENIEKCKRIMAEERQRHLDDMKETAKSEAMLRRMARNRVVTSLRESAYNYGISAKDHATKLVENAMREAQARVELECHEEIKKKVYKDHDKLYEMFDQERREEVTKELKESLEPVVVSRLELARIDEVKAKLAHELKDEVIHNLKVELEDDVTAQLRAEMERDVREYLHTSLKDEACKELRGLYTQQVIRDLKEELTPTVIEKIRHEQDALSAKHASADVIASNGAIAENDRERSNAANEDPPIAHAIAQVDAAAANQDDGLAFSTHKIAFIASETTVHAQRLDSPFEPIADTADHEAYETNDLAFDADAKAETGSSGATAPKNGGSTIREQSNELIDPAFRVSESRSSTSSTANAGANDAPTINRVFSDANQNAMTPEDSATATRKRSFSESSEGAEEYQRFVKRSRGDEYTADSDAGFEEGPSSDGYSSNGQSGYGSGTAQADFNEGDEEGEHREADFSLGPDGQQLLHGQPQYVSGGYFGFESDSESEFDSEEEENLQDVSAAQNVIKYTNTQDTAINLDDSDDDMSGDTNVERHDEEDGDDVEGDSTLVEDGGFVAINKAI